MKIEGQVYYNGSYHTPAEIHDFIFGNLDELTLEHENLTAGIEALENTVAHHNEKLQELKAKQISVKQRIDACKGTPTLSSLSADYVVYETAPSFDIRFVSPEEIQVTDLINRIMDKLAELNARDSITLQNRVVLLSMEDYSLLCRLNHTHGVSATYKLEDHMHTMHLYGMPVYGSPHVPTNQIILR